MNRSKRTGFVMLGFIGGLMLAGNAGAQSATGAGEGQYSGASGSQALQEQMYEDRMKEILGEPAQSPGMQRQTGMKGAEESSQKMQSDQQQSGKSTGDRTIDDQEKAKK